MSADSVQYRSLDFLGFPKYRVGDDGSVWSRNHRGKSKQFSHEVIQEIRRRYAEGSSYAKLAREFNCASKTVFRFVKGYDFKQDVWRPVKIVQLAGGYCHVSLQERCRKATFWVHRLVLLAFVGPCPDGMEACHFPDRNRANNHLRNLRWDTVQANTADKYVHGTVVRGSTSGKAKLHENDVQEMRSLHSSGGWSYSALGVRFHTSTTNAFKIVSYKTWRHVP